MRFHAEPIEFTRQPGLGAPIWHGHAADGEDWLRFAISVHRHDGRLAALWGSDERASGGGFRVHAVFALDEGWPYLILDLPADDPVYPDLAGIFPAASRMQRATYDLLGIRHDGEDQRPWLRHGGWPENWFPLRHDAGDPPAHENQATDYDFVQVGGEGAHEIPVGPIHAGIIEPGHFRFSVVGERILRMEERLGYQHKGTERRLAGADFATGAKLVGRVSGDSTVAFAWAFADAIEAACGVTPPARALAIRALLLERERIANHLGDLGALGNDAALAFGLSQFFRLKEDWVRLNAAVFGHRFLMDTIVPGGVVVDVDAEKLVALTTQCETIGREVKELQRIYDDHSGLQDRFLTTGAIDSALARELSLSGMAARATGMLLDARCFRQGYEPPPPWSRLAVRPALDERGDVAARIAVRFAEIHESLRLIRLICADLPDGETRATVTPVPDGVGVGVVEGWRGEVVVGVQLGKDGRLARCHPHDPSWQAWPVLEHAVLKDIVPDFPLINKSFNLSYSGHDI
ncbi:MAG: NADH-quinone oxidoreductase subunit C [Rhodocyclaceae bacterium]